MGFTSKESREAVHEISFVDGDDREFHLEARLVSETPQEVELMTQVIYPGDEFDCGTRDLAKIKVTISELEELLVRIKATRKAFLEAGFK